MKAAAIMGWVVAIVLAGIAAYLWGVNRDLNSEIEGAISERKDLLEGVEVQASRNAELESTVNELLERFEKAVADVARFRELVEALEAPAEPPR